MLAALLLVVLAQSTSGSLQAPALASTGCATTFYNGGCAWQDTPVLVLHGWEITSQSDCAGYWGGSSGGFVDGLRNLAVATAGHAPPLTLLGFYAKDTGCDDTLGPDLYSLGISNADNNTSIEDLGSGLRRYIHRVYGSQAVNIVTHSMGGLMVRVALDPQFDSAFPIPQVNHVVTISTPHEGMTQPACIGGNRISYEATEMCANSKFLTSLTGRAAASAGGTDWTLIGADSGGSGDDGVVPTSSATADDPGSAGVFTPGGLYGGLRLVYDSSANYTHTTIPSGNQPVDQQCAASASQCANGRYNAHFGWVTVGDHTLPTVVPATAQGFAGPPVVNVPGAAQFLSEYQRTAGSLGPPLVDGWMLTTPYPGQEQDFLKGSIYWSSGTGTHEVHGSLDQYYTNHGGPEGMFTFPMTDVTAVSGVSGAQMVTFPGTTCGSTWGSAIYTSAARTVSVVGCIYQGYGPGGPAALGLPTGDQQSVAGGLVQYFPGTSCPGVGAGSAIYSAGVGTFTVYGCIYQKYVVFGGPGSQLGFPISSEHTNSSGQRESDFQGGYITYTTSTGAVVHLNSTSGSAYPANTYGPGSGCCFSTVSVWFGGGGVGLIGKEIWTYANGSTRDSSATWTASHESPSFVYTVQAYIPNNHSNAPHAHYHIVGGDGAGGLSAIDVSVNQENYTNAWAFLTSICGDPTGTITVTLADDGGDPTSYQIGADAVSFTDTGRHCPF